MSSAVQRGEVVMKKRASKAKLIFLFGLTALLLVLAWSGLAVFKANRSAHLAWQEFSYVQAHQTELKTTSGRSDLSAKLREALGNLDEAKHQFSSAVGLGALRVIPVLDREIVGTSQIFDDAKVVDQELLHLLDAANKASTSQRGAEVGTRALDELDNAVKQATATLANTKRSPDGLFGPVRKYRLLLNEKLSSLRNSLVHAHDALQLAKRIYGGNGPSSLLVLAQNNAEMRDQGCMLSYALLSGVNGSLHLERSGPIHDLELGHATNQPMTPGTAQVFGINQPTTIWQSVNAPGDFSWSGATAAKMFEAKTGIHVDMVIGVDVVTMAGLLEALGPVQLTDPPVTVTSSTVEDLVLHQLYATYPQGNQQGRRDTLAGLVGAVFSKLATERLDPATLAAALAPSVAGRHLLLWSSRRTEEVAAVALGVSGRLDTTLPDRTFHLAVESAVAAKLDYYVDVAAEYQVSVLKNGNAWVETTITETNHAPAHQPPSYQLGPNHINSYAPGDYVSNTYLWVPRGAQTQRGVNEGGLVVSPASLKVPAQQSGHFVVWTFLPRAVQHGRLVLHFIPQPRLRPQALSVEVSGFGWKVTGKHSWSGPLAKSATFDFGMHQ